MATLIIDRPPLNPLSHQAKADLLRCLEEIAADHTIRCMILHGAGGRAFSVGADTWYGRTCALSWRSGLVNHRENRG